MKTAFYAILALTLIAIVGTDANACGHRGGGRHRQRGGQQQCCVQQSAATNCCQSSNQLPGYGQPNYGQPSYIQINPGPSVDESAAPKGESIRTPNDLRVPESKVPENERTEKRDEKDRNKSPGKKDRNKSPDENDR